MTKPRPPRNPKLRELWNNNLHLKAALKKARIERNNLKRLVKGSK